MLLTTILQDHFMKTNDPEMIDSKLQKLMIPYTFKCKDGDVIYYLNPPLLLGRSEYFDTFLFGTSNLPSSNICECLDFTKEIVYTSLLYLHGIHLDIERYYTKDHRTHDTELSYSECTKLLDIWMVKDFLKDPIYNVIHKAVINNITEITTLFDEDDTFRNMIISNKKEMISILSFLIDYYMEI